MIDSRKKSLYIIRRKYLHEEKVLKVFEFNKVKEQLLEHVSSSLRKRKGRKT